MLQSKKRDYDILFALNRNLQTVTTPEPGPIGL